jgi:hypothetical protein
MPLARRKERAMHRKPKETFLAKDLAEGVDHAVMVLNQVSSVLHAMPPRKVLVRMAPRSGARTGSGQIVAATISQGVRPWLAGYCPPPEITVVPARRGARKKVAKK